MATLSQCSEQPAGRTKRTTRGEEARIDTREGPPPSIQHNNAGGLTVTSRSTPRGPPKKHNAARSRKNREIKTLTTSGNENVASEDEDGVEAIGAATILTDGRHETRGLRLPGAEAHLAFPLIGVQSIRTFPLVVVAAGQTTEDVDRRPQEDHCRTPDPDPGHHRVEDIETMTPQNHVDASLLRVGLGLPHGEAMLEVESEEFQDAVMIELDPSHLQMLLAHVHPEAEEGARLPSHLAVRRRLLDLNPIVEGRTHHCLQALDLVH